MGPAGEAELAALGAPDAIARDRPGIELRVHLAHGGDGGAGAVVPGAVRGGHFNGRACDCALYSKGKEARASNSAGDLDNVKTSTKRRLIVNGAGPVGLTMACELARHGIEFRIFEKNAAPTTQSRALGIFPRTLEVFSSLGVLDDVLAEGRRLEAFSIYNDTRRLARMKFENIDSPYPFAIALPQSRTERILEARLAALGVRVERQMEMTGLDQDRDGVRARYRGTDGREESVEGAWLVGCDGAHSASRHLLGMKFQGEQYEEEFMLADVKVETDLADNEAHLFLTSEGILAYFPFAHGHGRLIADQRRGAKHEAGEPSLEEVAEIVRRRCFRRLEVGDVAWKAWFRISRRMVKRYASGRVFLAGDAAHIHSPAGGQGMNTGIQDAFNLGWKLALVARGLAAPELLDTYEAERMPVARSVLNLTDRITRAATAHYPGAQPLRDLLVPMLTGIPFVKEAMAERLAEVSIDYRGSPLVENHGLGPVHAGDRAPDAVLYDRAARAERRVFDLLKTPGFLLLDFEGNEAVEAGEDALGDLPGKVYRVTRPGREFEPGTLEDRDCRACIAYGACEERLLVLIRPDGYVGYKGGSAAALAAYIDRLKGNALPTAAGPAR